VLWKERYAGPDPALFKHPKHDIEPSRRATGLAEFEVGWVDADREDPDGRCTVGRDISEAGNRQIVGAAAAGLELRVVPQHTVVQCERQNHPMPARHQILVVRPPSIIRVGCP
jgi:hypothetical protein